MYFTCVFGQIYTLAVYLASKYFTCLGRCVLYLCYLYFTCIFGYVYTRHHVTCILPAYLGMFIQGTMLPVFYLCLCELVCANTKISALHKLICSGVLTNIVLPVFYLCIWADLYKALCWRGHHICIQFQTLLHILDSLQCDTVTHTCVVHLQPTQKNTHI